MLVLLAVVAGCSDDSDGPTMTRTQAKQRTGAYFAQAVGALPQPVDVGAEESNGSFCFKNDDPSEHDGRVVEVTAKGLPGIGAERHTEAVATLRARLESMGFQRDDEGEISTLQHFKNPADNFTAVIAGIGRSGSLMISFASPCVWPDGTKPSGR